MHKLKKWFIIVLSVSFFCTIFGQFLLLNDSIRNRLSTVYSIESKYVYSEQQVPRGSVVVRISNPNQGIYLLQNGEPVAELTQKIHTIDVLDNTVIEIDGRKCNENFYVAIDSVSENVDGFYETKIRIEGNIVILGRFFIK